MVTVLFVALAMSTRTRVQREMNGTMHDERGGGRRHGDLDDYFNLMLTLLRSHRWRCSGIAASPSAVAAPPACQTPG
jgi:hypothetical protein